MSTSRYKTRSVSKISDTDQNSPQTQSDSQSSQAKKANTSLPKRNQRNVSTRALESCPCKNTCSKDTNLHWVCCDSCNQWWHTHCLGLTTTESKKLEDSFYICPLCSISKIADNPVVIEAIQSEIQEKTGFSEGDSASQISEHTHKDSYTCSNEHVDHVKSSQNYSPENIVIVDNIKLTKELSNSKKLKSEINKVKPEIKLKQAYPLAGGGIALHCADRESQEVALADWPKSSLNSDNTPRPHKIRNQQCTQSIIVRSVSTKFTEPDILSNLQKNYSSVTSVHRLHNKTTQAPFPIIKVTLQRDQAAKILASQTLKLFGRNHPCETCRSIKIVRCYSCQRFGHTASTCVYFERCINCSGSHTHTCSLPPRCSNCNGEHKSDSKLCPTFLNLKHRLEIRKIVPAAVHSVSLPKN